MTPKEKATELVKKMYGNIFDGGQYEDAEESWYNAKECALIAVDEILEICKQSLDLDHLGYWLEVKQEIEKL